MSAEIAIRQLEKVYEDGFRALTDINLDIQRGEIFALLGPNGAGKTTLISIVCGLVNASGGSVSVAGHDIIRDYRGARESIGLVPQELSTDSFESVWRAISFSRGLFGKPPNPDHIEKVLRDLSLWDKRNNRLMSLSGGMKRRVMIAKALSHEPGCCFWTSPRPVSTWNCGATCGPWCAACAKAVSPSFSPPTTSRRRRRWPTASA